MHQLVNKKLNNVKMHGTNVKMKNTLILCLGLTLLLVRCLGVILCNLCYIM